MKGFSGRRIPKEPLEMVKYAATLLQPGSQVLDLAAGEGRHAGYLAQKGFFVTAVDNSEQKLEQLKQNSSGNVTPVLADVLEFDSQDTYDLILCTGLLHFLESTQIESIIAKMKHLTAPGGYHLIGVRMNQNPRGSLTHVFQSQELKDYYQDPWQVIKYQEADFPNPPRKVQLIITQLTD